jgi:hypothetical protein
MVTRVHVRRFQRPAKDIEDVFVDGLQVLIKDESPIYTSSIMMDSGVVKNEDSIVALSLLTSFQ